MATYYLDIETTGLDESSNDIITIQYQELERGSGRPIGNVTILKAWEGGEKEMLVKLIDGTKICSAFSFDCIPVGYNLGFEHKFLMAKSRLYGLPEINVLSHPCIDLHSIGIMMNRGEFKGSGLDKITGKKQSGGNIPQWYGSKHYDLIEEYITDETDAFTKWYMWLLNKLPQIREEWNTCINDTTKMTNDSQTVAASADRIYAVYADKNR